MSQSRQKVNRAGGFINIRTGCYAWFKYRKVETMQWITLILVVVMGGLTLILHDEQFVKWKLSIIEWLFGGAFLGSQFIGKKPLRRGRGAIGICFLPEIQVCILVQQSRP